MFHLSRLFETYIVYQCFSRDILVQKKKTQNKTPTTLQLQQLPAVCQKLELRLAREAATKEEYADESTLIARLNAIRGEVQSEIEDAKAHNRAVIARSAFGRSAEAILKYVGIMSHTMTCDVVGRCSVEDCAGMKTMLQHEKECSEGEECKRCHTLERIRLIASASFL